MLFSLALIPVIILLIIIYKRDKKEKEPLGLLTGLFFAGMGTVITALIIEAIGLALFDLIIPYDSAVKEFLSALIIIAPAEELGKYAVLRLITWKNKNFNYSYDAIVYAVFVSLGFAALENIAYVISMGLGVAILRMFTAIPGHASDAVFMGYFYSRAKYAHITGKKDEYSKNITLTLLVPIILHGFYDAIILGGSTTDNLVLMGSSLILWIGYVIVLFVLSIITVVRASRNDFCITTFPGNIQTVYIPSVMDPWVCECGTGNNMNFCSNCGRMRPAGDIWHCRVCGCPSGYNFCACCGSPRP